MLLRLAFLIAPVLAQAAEVLPGDPIARLSEPLRKEIERLAPGTLADATATGADAAGAQLARLARLLGRPGTDVSALEELLTPEFRFQPRAEGASAPPALDRAAFQASFATLLLGARDVRVRLEPAVAGRAAGAGPVAGPGSEALPTRARLGLRAVRPEDTLEVRGEWECAWSPDSADGRAPRLAGVRELAREELRIPAAEPLFTDCSAAVFGASPAWSAELVPDLAAWRGRLDARLGLPLLGHAAGIAVGDVNGDGLEDLYLCQPGGLPNLLFLHQPDDSVRDVSAEAGVDFLDVSRAALLVDLDGDGDRDLAVSAGERLLLLANEGRTHFWLQAALEAPQTTSLAVADIDLDGDLDLFACAAPSPYDHAELPVPVHDARDGRPARLYENHGDWIFVDATEARGLAGNRRFSLAAAFEDYDGDGDPDLAVANEFGPANLYRNDGAGFVDVAGTAGLAEASAGTGVAWGDFDGDRRFDLFVSRRNGGARALFGNRGDGTFAPALGSLSFANGGASWGALFADLDGDGWQDLLVPGGFLTGELGDDLSSAFEAEVAPRSPLDAAPTPEAAEAYRAAWSALNLLLRRGHSWSGHAPNGVFQNRAGAGFVGLGASGLGEESDLRALATIDWDGDGDLDLFATARGAPRVRFLRNDARAEPAFVTLELVGTHANRDAIGARVELALAAPGAGSGGERRLTRAVRAGEGCLAQSSARLTLGLGGSAVTIAETLVTWPGGRSERFAGVQPGRLWRLVEGSGTAQLLERARARPLAPGGGVPSPEPECVRLALARPVALPRLELASADGGALSLFGIQAGGAGQGTGKNVLLALVSTGAASARELRDLADHAAELGQAGLAPLALAVEPAERERFGAVLKEAGWPFPWATAAPETLEVLDALAASLRDGEQRLVLPSSFLVDARGELRVLYLGPVSAAQVLADRARCELEAGALFDGAAAFPGRWMFPELPSDADFFEGRLRARGLETAANEFARGRMVVVHSTPADLLQEFGRKCVLDGRLEEAEGYFRRALAADPRHFGALFDWALVLHRQEKLAAAAELYERALALRPEHADARFDLALARLGLGDRAFAEAQLRWLEARGAASASVLAKVLAETAPGK